MSDNPAKAALEAAATGASSTPALEAAQVTGASWDATGWHRNGFLDDVADVARAIAGGLPVNVGQAVRALGALAAGAVLATMLVGLLGISGGVLGALAAAAGVIGVDVLLQIVGR
jgi:hypothetical protein